VSTQKGGKSWRARRVAKQQRQSVGLNGLRACRVAASLTQKELAELVGSNQTTIVDLEYWDRADDAMLQRLCRALKVAPEDLISWYSVENAEFEEGQESQGESTFETEKAERRRQVNRIKRRGHRTGAPGTVLLRGLKDRRVDAGLTQRELARMIGTNQTTISELEKGTYRGAYMKTIRKLCQALQVSPADLICKESAKK
jgi:transcriptional regulator with XRE-family HTH domain